MEHLIEQLQIHYCYHQEHFYKFEKSGRQLQVSTKEFGDFLTNDYYRISKEIIYLEREEYWLKCSNDDWKELIWLRNACGLITEQDFKE